MHFRPAGSTLYFSLLPQPSFRRPPPLDYCVYITSPPFHLDTLKPASSASLHNALSFVGFDCV